MSNTLDDEKKNKLSQKFDSGRKNVDEQDINRAADDTGKKIFELEVKGIPHALEKLWGDIRSLWQMLSDSIKGRYKVPVRTAGAITFTLLYFINPVDLIPDFIPFVGYVDDAFVVTLCISFIGKDLEEYKKWKEEKNNSVDSQ